MTSLSIRIDIRWKAIVVLALLPALSGAQALERPSPPTRVQAVVAVPLHAGAGVAKAGMICLPSGRFHVGDFVESEARFVDEAQRIWPANGDHDGEVPAGRKTSLRIELVGIDASLCARRYGAFGLGDRRALSGRVEFRFNWSISDDPEIRQEAVSLNVPKASAKPAAAMLPDALALLAQRIQAGRRGP